MYIVLCTIFAKIWLQIKKFLYLQQIRPVQHEVLSSYLSGLVVLAGLFFIPSPFVLLPEFSRQELPVAVWHGPEIFWNGYRSDLADVEEIDAIGFLYQLALLAFWSGRKWKSSA